MYSCLTSPSSDQTKNLNSAKKQKPLRKKHTHDPVLVVPMLMNPCHQATPSDAVRTHYDLETLTSLQLLAALGALGSAGGLLGEEVWGR